MNNIKYSIVESTVSFNDLPLITYGIAVHDTSSSEDIIACISDITFDKKSLEQIVDLCNREKLSPIHLNDVVEDYLCR